MTHNAQSETLSVEEAGRLAQGDIVQWLSGAPPLTVAGIVVTAECDLEKRKHGGILSYVPILPLEDYWQTVTLPKSIESVFQDSFLKITIDRLASLTRKVQAENAPPASTDALLDMMNLTPEVLVASLQLEAQEAETLIEMRGVYHAVASISENQSFANQCALLTRLKSCVAGKPKEISVATTVAELKNSVHQLPGDAFFLSEVHGLDGAGFVAYLRLVRELRADAVALKTPDLRKPGVAAKRIARLCSPYLFRLTQQLGQVFSDIGLPEHYELKRKSTAAAVHDSIVQRHASQAKT